MNLIALLIGLVIERLATQIFHWRRMRFMDRIIDSGFRYSDRFKDWPPVVPVIVLALLLALPVFIVIIALGDALAGFPYLILAIVVLFFSLGPNDIGEDVREYCVALEEGDEERLQQTAKALVESDVPANTRECLQAVESAVFVQANNRLYAIIFWFMLLGPLGAWLYRGRLRHRGPFRRGIRRMAQAPGDRTRDTVGSQRRTARARRHRRAGAQRRSGRGPEGTRYPRRHRSQPARVPAARDLGGHHRRADAVRLDRMTAARVPSPRTP